MIILCKMGLGKCTFNENWLKDEKFKEWLAKDYSDKRGAFCKACNKAFSVASMGRSALVSHML